MSALTNLTIALLVISWVAVSLRMGVRLFMIRSFGWDDFFLLAALATYSASAILDLTRGSGEIASRADLLELLEFVLVAPLLYAIENIFMRISLGFFFLRFLVDTWQRRYVYISISIYTAYALSYLIVNAAFYGNTHKLANKMLNGECAGASCGHWPVIGPMSYTLAALNTFIDLTFAALPVLFIRKANMPFKTKLSVCCLLGLGNISSIASIMRFPYIGNLNVTSGVLPADTFIIATTVEQAAGICALAAAALRPLFALKLTRTLLGSSRYGHGDSNVGGPNTHSEHSEPKDSHMLATLNTVNVRAVTEVTEHKATGEAHRGLGTMTTITAASDPEKGSEGSPHGHENIDDRISDEYRF